MQFQMIYRMNPMTATNIAGTPRLKADAPRMPAIRKSQKSSLNGFMGGNPAPPEYTVVLPLPAKINSGISMTEERECAILSAATLLCARKLIELDSDRPSPAKSRTRPRIGRYG